MRPSHGTDLTTGSVPAHLVRLSVPMIWGILSIVSMQLADVYFVAGLGQVPLEAIGFTFPVSMVIFNLVMGLSIGTSSVASRLIGAGDRATFQRFIVHAMMIAVLTGVVLVWLGEFFLIPIFALLGAGPEHMVHIMPFMRIQLWGYVFITVPLVLNAAMRAQGDTRLPAAIMVSAAVVNVPLAYAFVYGAGPFPTLGMTGAAIANVCANFFIAAMALGFMTMGKRGLHHAAAWHITGFRQSLARLLPIAVPVGLMNLMQPMTTAIITAMLATSGASAVAAYGIIGRIEAVAAVVLMALSVGLSPLVGQNFGAGQFARVVEGLKTAIGFCVIWSVITGVTLMIFAGPLARAFSDHPQTILIVTTYFWIMGITKVMPNIVVGWGSLWYAMGKPRYGVVNNVSILLVGTVMCGALGHMINGWYGLFVGMMIGQMITGLALHFWSRTRLRALMPGVMI